MATRISGSPIRARIGGVELAKPLPEFTVTSGTDFVGLQFGSTVGFTLPKAVAEALSEALWKHAELTA